MSQHAILTGAISLDACFNPRLLHVSPCQDEQADHTRMQHCISANVGLVCDDQG